MTWSAKGWLSRGVVRGVVMGDMVLDIMVAGVMGTVREMGQAE